MINSIFVVWSQRLLQAIFLRFKRSFSKEITYFCTQALKNSFILISKAVDLLKSSGKLFSFFGEGSRINIKLRSQVIISSTPFYFTLNCELKKKFTIAHFPSQGHRVFLG